MLVCIHTSLLGLIAGLGQYPKTNMQWVRFTCPVTCWLCSSVRRCLQSGQVSSAACSLHSGSQRSWSRRTEVQMEGRGTRHQDRSKPLAARWAQTQGEQSLCSEERDKTMRIRKWCHVLFRDNTDGCVSYWVLIMIQVLSQHWAEGNRRKRSRLLSYSSNLKKSSKCWRQTKKTYHNFLTLFLGCYWNDKQLWDC